MANTKKYVSLDKLGVYDELIKGVIATGDSTTLATAKSYADGLASNYDAAGSAASALESANTYTDGKISEVDGVVAGVKTTAEKGVSDAAKAQAAADKAQGEVDALETYVGTIPSESTATDVVGYVIEKTTGIASQGAMTELTNRVTQAEKDIDAIEADYLKTADKTALQNSIDAVSGAVTAEQGRAEGAEEALDAKIKGITDDYLKAADKTELSDAIATEKGRAEGAEEALSGRIKAVEDDYVTKAEKEAIQTQINTIMNNPETDKVIDSINEFTAWIDEHGDIANGMKETIDQNKKDIAANTKAIEDAATLAGQTYATKTELANEKKALQDEIDADVKVVADDLVELDGVVAGLASSKADQSALEAAIEALEGADSAMTEKITALEGKFSGEGSVEDQIAYAKQEAIDAAAQDASDKDAVVLSEAQKYTDSKNTAMDERVAALEAIDHDHANKALLDTYTQTEADLADAVAKKHSHAHFDVIEGITATKVAAWDAAEQNAKTYAKDYADGLDSAMGERVAALETWHNNFSEVSEDEIKALFGIVAG